MRISECGLMRAMLSSNPHSAFRNLVGAAQSHDRHVVVTVHAGSEVREVCEADIDERAGQKLVLRAEQAEQSLATVLSARVVARLGESVGEEKERVAAL